jgi:Leucine rich repeat/Leucine Rich Repeat
MNLLRLPLFLMNVLSWVALLLALAASTSLARTSRYATTTSTVTNPASTTSCATVNAAAPPTITTGSVTGTITACAGTASVSPAVQRFLVSGANLTTDIVATAPTGFEISINFRNGYGASVTLPQSNGSVATRRLYVRSAAAATGTVSGNVSLTSTGATTINIPVTGTIIASSPDYVSLVDLYNAANGPFWTNSTNWLSGCTPCGWYGVTCDGNGRVIQLDLGTNQLSGTLPASLSALTSLQTLDLQNNQLSGTIPASLSTLTNLQLLSLTTNQLSGTIPASLSTLTNLQSLVLNENQLSGSIPASLGALTNLQFLFLQNNQLSGSLPASLGTLTNLQDLDVSTNQLSGTIPASLGTLTNLQLLNLSTNQLSGSIPASLGTLTNLQYLFLSTNQLSGTLPASLGALTSLQTLNLSTNQLSGSLPASLSTLTNLQDLDVSTNQLSGTIPASLGTLTSLKFLILNDNQLSGTFPASLGTLTNLEFLLLQNNQLSGCYAASLSALCEIPGLFKDFSGNTGLPDGGSDAGFSDFCSTGLSSNLPVIISANPSFTIVQGNSTQLTAAGADTYRWSTSQTTNPISASLAGPYSVTGTTTAGCSNTATQTIIVTNPLPVTLRYFNGRMTDAGALLGWATAREDNNSVFQIERSRDAVGFESIGTVQTQAVDGVSVTPLTYTFTDAQPLPGINYYRLIQTDRDGTRAQAGNMLALSREGATPVLFPNPMSASGEAVIEPGITHIGYQISDMLGRVVQRQDAPGVLSRVSLAGLPAGVYVLRVQTADGSGRTFRVLR